MLGSANFVVVSFILFAAQSASNDLKLCGQGSGQAALDACNALISSGQLHNHDLAAAYVFRAYNYNRLGDLDAALIDYTHALVADPTYYVALNNRCAVYNAKQYYEKAVKDCEKAIELKPESPQPYIGRANAYRYLNKIDYAIEDYKHAIELNGSIAEAYFGRALAYAQKGTLDSAIEDYSSLIRLTPNDVIGLNNRGVLFDKLKKYPHAISDFKAALQVQPDYERALVNLCLTYRLSKDLDSALATERALASCNRAIELRSDNAFAYVIRGLVYQDKSDFTHAIADFRRAIELDQNSINACTL